MNEIAALLKTAQTIAVLPHTSPDADTLGSCFALAYALGKQGKSTMVYTDEAIPEYLSFLDGKYEIFAGEAPVYDVCLCLDCGDMERLGGRAAVFAAAAYTINIDHHYTNTNFADYNLVEPLASSTGEICYRLLQYIGAEIDTYIASCLYAALSGDTGGFRYSNTSASSLRTAADLMEHGIDAWEINRLLFGTEDIAALRFKGSLSQRIQVLEGGLVAVVTVDAASLAESGLASDQLENIVDIPRQVRGAEVAVSFKESDGEVKVSLRSNAYIDVGDIAVRLGGGGHKRAAGLTVKAGLELAQELVLGALSEAFSTHRNTQKE